MNAWQTLRNRLAVLRQAPGRASWRWHGQYWAERLGRGGLLALGATLVLAIHCSVALWPEFGALQAQRVELIAELDSCAPAHNPPGESMERVRAELRTDPDHRKLAMMEMLAQAGLLLVDIQYQGEDTIQGRLRRTSVDVTAVGSYLDLTAGLQKLAEQPLLRLESLALDRQKPEHMLVNVKLRLSMLGEAG